MAGKVKICPACNSVFPAKDNRQKACCLKCAHKLKPSRNRIVGREYDLKKAYGISVEDWSRMYEEQNGCCAICNRHQAEFKKRLSVDHCHKTGKIRGLLCQPCNHAIGLFKENTYVIQKALEYLYER